MILTRIRRQSTDKKDLGFTVGEKNEGEMIGAECAIVGTAFVLVCRC